MDWNAGRIMLALARHFDWFHNHMFPEYDIDGGRADLIFCTKAGYLTEVEIKISIADWRADRWKAKFERERPHIARFFYAVPADIAEQVPAHVPITSGILAIHPGTAYVHDRVEEIRTAVRQKAQKVPDHHIRKMHENAYYRYWNQQIQVLSDRRWRQIRRQEARESSAS